MKHIGLPSRLETLILYLVLAQFSMVWSGLTFNNLASRELSQNKIQNIYLCYIVDTKLMKKYIINHFRLIFIIELAIIVILVISVFIGTYYLVTKNKTKGIDQNLKTSSNDQECHDLKCLATASKNCTPKKATITQSVDVFGVKQTSTTFYELKSAGQSKCELYTKYLDFKFEYPADTSKEAIEQNNKHYSEKMLNKDGSCVYSTPVLASLFEEWIKGKMSSGDITKAEKCSGAIYENTPDVP